MGSDAELSYEEWRHTWADSYILMCIGEFDHDAEAALAKTLENSPTKITPDEWRKTFEGDFSIIADLPSIIESLWREQKRDEPSLTPRAFAERNREEIFMDVLYG
jgi:hypothetical protein